MHANKEEKEQRKAVRAWVSSLKLPAAAFTLSAMTFMRRYPIRLAGALGLAFSLTAFAGQPQLKIKTTLGEITLELDAEKAPISTLNFIQYAQSNFYDGTIFHRVMPNFMIQGGGFTKTIDLKTEGLRPPIKNEWKNGLKNVRGTISMARTAEPDSATAQFFINVVDNPALDQPSARTGNAGYAVFGKVLQGLDIVDKIRNVETQEHPKYPGGKVVPIEDVVIQSARIVGEYDLQTLQKKVSDSEKATAAKAAAEAAKQKAFLTENAKKKGVKTTDSGLQYRIIREGKGPKPKATDKVQIHYRGQLIDGTEFDSSYSRNTPASFSLNQVIRGFGEGLQLIAVGGKAELFIPAELAYKDRGVGNVIPPNSTLVFEVELLEIIPPAPPSATNATPSCEPNNP